jgi:Icc-related predicted phosphoesterase
MKNIAVFGDTHGHLRLLFQICRLWQRAHKRRLDAILQCGDLGYFPNPKAIDRATKKFAKDDAEELGFSRYFRQTGPTEDDPLLHRILLGAAETLDSVTCPFFWCHGNHEDFRALEAAIENKNRVAVDRFNRLEYVRSGSLLDLNGLSIGALGGGPERAQDSVRDTDAGGWRLVSEHAAKALLAQSFDVLLTHVGPQGVGGETEHYGSNCVRRVIESCQPAYHFFAHHNDPIAPTSIGRTRCYWLNDVNFQDSPGGQINPGCMGVLSWDDEAKHTFHVVEQSWLTQLTRHNWLHY